jgi:hypothetical protein
MTTDHDDTASSATDHAIAELQLHGYRPFQDEPIQGHCPKADSSEAPSPTSSTR